MKLKSFLFLWLLAGAVLPGLAHPADTVTASIHVQHTGPRAAFTAELPVLTGIPGGRQPFYTYLWDFGDGHFSTEATPTHQYSHPGEYEVTLYTVNNYDDGPRPKRPTRKVKVDSAQTTKLAQVSAAEANFFGTVDQFKLTKNANALPGQDMVVIAGLKTEEKGTVLILTNEKIFGPPGFVYAGQSTYNGETVSPIVLAKDLQSRWAAVPGVTETQSGSPDYGMVEERSFTGNEAAEYFADLYGSYNTVTSYTVDGQSAAQFSLVNLDITPEMLADTNATVTITGIFIPDNGLARVHRLDVPIVTSHDPNKMSLKQSRLSYRKLSKREKLTYKVQFQNDGEGDAKNIRLAIKLPDVVDPSTFELLNLYPKIDSCGDRTGVPCYHHYVKDADTLVFQFSNIALPGSKAADVHDKDSTQGFIRFTVRPRKKLPNRSFRGQTAIYFDKNEPVITNTATGRFRKGFSPLVFAGYQLNEKGRHGPLLGLGLAPIAPYRKLYWQVEVYANAYRETDKETIFEYGDMEYTNPATNRLDGFTYERYDRQMEARFIQLRVVPLHLRYNFNSWVSAGAGALVETSINTRYAENRTYYLFNASSNIEAAVAGPTERLGASRLQVQPFADINIGRTYLGPVLGLRYLYGSRQGHLGHCYAAWRF